MVRGAGVQEACSGEDLAHNWLASNLEREEVCLVGGGGGGTCSKDVGGRKSDGVGRNWPATSAVGQGDGEGVVGGSWEGTV